MGIKANKKYRMIKYLAVFVLLCPLYLNAENSVQYDTIEALKTNAEIKIDKGYFYEAYSIIEKIEAVCPTSVDALMLKAKLFAEMGYPFTHNAEDICNLLIEKGFFVSAYSLLASIYERDERYKEAFHYYKKLHEYDMLDISAITNASECALRSGEYREAEKLLLEGCALFADNIDLKLQLADFYRYTSGSQTALPALLAAKRISPSNKEVLKGIALSYNDLGKYDLAADYMRQACENSDISECDYHQLIQNKILLQPRNANIQQNLNQPVSHNSEFQKYEQQIFESFYKGNLYELYDNIEMMLIALPQSPEAFLYIFDLTRLADVVGSKRVENTINALIKNAALLQEFENKNYYLLQLNLQLSDLLEHYDNKNALSMRKELSSIDKWMVAGPYKKYGRADIDYAFMPELAANLKESDIEYKTVSGIKLFTDEAGIVYAFASIKISSPVKIRIYSDGEYKLSVNGREIIRNLRNETFRKSRVIRIWNATDLSFMLKADNLLHGNPKIILTDDKDNLLYFNASEQRNFSRFDYLEVLDFPFNDLMKLTDETAQFRMASYFNELNSIEAIHFYESYIDKCNNPVLRYLAAEKFLSVSQNKVSALFNKGISIIEKLVKENPGFLPAQTMYLVYNSNNIDDIVNRIFLMKDSDYLPLYLDTAFLLLSGGYETEFLETINLARTRFPYSSMPLLLLAKFYSDKNPNKAAELLREILTRENSFTALSELARIWRSQGKYSEAAEAIQNYDNSGGFSKELAYIIIASDDTERAKKTIFNLASKSKDPYFDFAMGAIALKNNDAYMYWEKFLSAKPSVFNVADYQQYTKEKKIVNPFSEYLTKDNYISCFRYIASEPESPADFADFIFLINKDGGSRCYINHLIYLTKESDLAKYNLYPLNGSIIPVRSRIYKLSGEFTDIFSLDLIDTQYPALAEICYLINNPDIKADSFFATQFIRPCGKDSFYRFCLTAVASETLDLNIFYNQDIKARISKINDKVIYTITDDKTDSNSLPYSNPLFSISSMKDFKDFVLWYESRLLENNNNDNLDITNFAGGSVAEIADKVYHYAADIQAVQKADYGFSWINSESKVLHAKSMLTLLGVKSYIAFAAKNNFQDTKGFVSPYSFTDILLYVPMNKDTGIWMDFSGSDKCGEVAKSLSNQDAVIIINSDYELKKITILK